MGASKPVRAGGWVNRGDGKGWVLDRDPKPAPPPPVAPPPASAGPMKAGGWVMATDQPAPAAPTAVPPPVDPTGVVVPRELVGDAEPDRAICPDCGKDVATRKDGTLRKHVCVDGED